MSFAASGLSFSLPITERRQSPPRRLPCFSHLYWVTLFLALQGSTVPAACPPAFPSDEYAGLLSKKANLQSARQLNAAVAGPGAAAHECTQCFTARTTVLYHPPYLGGDFRGVLSG